jgi:diaminohydroxyphosphoribosylaminopyrimidine deaminase/5-amino-6-(5-phosphoribosylamino)uracil reductase
MKFSAADIRFMRRALALARRGAGTTSPNPCVGAVLVKNGRIIAEDYHKRAGEPHAEVFVFRKAGKRARGATLYVTMEPCCTHGRTPPCTDAIIASGVKRVVYAATDPNPKHRGRGAKILRRAGIRVDVGLLAEESEKLNEVFHKWMKTGLPFVVAKAAMSLDGKIATRTGDSKWITPASVRKIAHELRAKVDAVMVGANTVVKDNPKLTVRLVKSDRQPLRVVMDARGKCPRTATLFTDKHRDKTIVVTTKQSPARWRRYLALLGITVLLVKRKGMRVDLRAAMRALARLNVSSVLMEGGGESLGSAFDEKLVDKIVFFYAPIVIGGRGAVPAVGGKGVEKVALAHQFSRNFRCRKLGNGVILVEGYRE